MKKKYMILIIVGLFLIICSYFGYKSYKLYANVYSIKTDELEEMWEGLKVDETIKVNIKKEANYLSVAGIKIKDDFKDFEQSNRFTNDESGNGYVLKDNQDTMIWIGKSKINIYETFSNEEKWLDKMLEEKNIKNDLDLLVYAVNNKDKKPNIFSSVDEMKFYNFIYYINIQTHYLKFESIKLIDGDLKGYILETKDMPIREIYLIDGTNLYVISLWNKEYFTYDYIKELLNTIVIEDKSNNTNNNEADKVKEKVSYLQQTKTIVFNSSKYSNKKITINEENISKIIEIISKGKELEKNEIVPSIGAGYEMNLLDDEDNIIETIKFYLPYGYNRWISLEKINTSYYVDTNTIIDILNLEKE